MLDVPPQTVPPSSSSEPFTFPEVNWIDLQAHATGFLGALGLVIARPWRADGPLSVAQPLCPYKRISSSSSPRNAGGALRSGGGRCFDLAATRGCVLKPFSPISTIPSSCSHRLRRPSTTDTPRPSPRTVPPSMRLCQDFGKVPAAVALPFPNGGFVFFSPTAISFERRRVAPSPTP